MEKRAVIEAKTFTPLYDEIEDRIRLVINYKDLYNRVDLLITRAFIIKFMPAYEEYLEKHFPNGEVITSTTQSQPTKSSQYQTQTESDYIDLVQKEELLRQVDFKITKDRKFLLIFTTENFKIKAILSDNLAHALFNSIKESIPNFTWSLFL
jgi:hypothetical protein